MCPPLRQKKLQIRKYGFHGISHKSASENLKGNTLTIHLWQGSSITAIKNNKPIETSMGLTPLDGIVMMTRPGSIDPGLVLLLEKDRKIKAGLKELTGYEDFQKITQNLKNKNCAIAYKLFINSIKKYIGAYSAILGGVDNIVFTGAIGEDSEKVRNDVCKGLEFLSKNKKINILHKKTNEEFEIAKEVLKCVSQ